MTTRREIQTLIDSLARDYVPEAARALQVYGKAAIEPLIRALWHKGHDPYAHDTYAEILISILLATEHQRAVDLLVPLVEHENADVRRRVVLTLGSLGDRRALPILRIALYDRNDSVRHAAAYAVIEVAYGGDSAESLRAALADAEAHVRYIAVRSLEFMDASSYMLEAARNDEPRVRRIAVYYVGKARLSAGYDLLIDALQDPDDEVCLGAIWSLGQIGNPKVIPALEELVADPSHNVARAAREALLKLGKPVA
jgi:HEAT repeat protein